MPSELGTVVVTRGASGLGRAVAEAVAAAGGTPVVLDLDAPDGGGEHERVDLADTAAAEAAVERVAQRHGGLNGVVTAAGTDACGRLADVPQGGVERVVMVNLLGTAAVVRAALPHLERSQARSSPWPPRSAGARSPTRLPAAPRSSAWSASPAG